MDWNAQNRELRPVLGREQSRPSWNLGSHEIDEEDGELGGTFYRPERPTWINGTADPAATAGNEGNYFLNTTAREWWGPKGVEDEETGEGSWPGPYSLPSGTWTNGTGDPADETGNDGEYYLDTAARAWWGPKASDTWADTGPHHVAAGWVDLIDGPVAQGLFSVPGCLAVAGEAESEDAPSVTCELELADSNGARIALVDIADVSGDGGRVGGLVDDLLIELDMSATIAKARWIVTGTDFTEWEASGNLVKLK